MARGVVGVVAIDGPRGAFRDALEHGAPDELDELALDLRVVHVRVRVAQGLGALDEAPGEFLGDLARKVLFLLVCRLRLRRRERRRVRSLERQQVVCDDWEVLCEVVRGLSVCSVAGDRRRGTHSQPLRVPMEVVGAVCD